jgi:hypothetical protein
MATRAASMRDSCESLDLDLLQSFAENYGGGASDASSADFSEDELTALEHISDYFSWKEGILGNFDDVVLTTHIFYTTYRTILKSKIIENALEYSDRSFSRAAEGFIITR